MPSSQRSQNNRSEQKADRNPHSKYNDMRNREEEKTITLYKYLSEKALENFVKEKTIKLSFGYEANDRFEILRGDLLQKNTPAEQEAEFPSGTRVGFISLTSVKENPYMWGYYSEKYSGARLKLIFKVKQVDDGEGGIRYLRTDTPSPRQEKFMNFEFTRFDGEYIEKCEYELNRLDKINTNLGKSTKNLISNKHISWSEEREYRILYSINNLKDNALSTLLQSPAIGIYTTSDINRNIVSLELGPFCKLMASDVKRELVSDELLRGISVHRLEFAQGVYQTVRKHDNTEYENYVYNNNELLKLLREKEIRPIRECGWTSFMYAARRGEYEALEELHAKQKKHGSDDDNFVKRRDIYGNNALSLAVLARSRACVEYLLEIGAEMKSASQRMKNNALIWAASIGFDCFVEKLLSWRSDETCCKPDAVCCEPDTEKGDKRTALHWAARNGHATCVKTIVEHINNKQNLSNEQKKDELNRKDGEGRTPLMLAAWAKNLETVQCLVEAKADVKATDDEYSTALIMAAWGKYEDDEKDEKIVSFLLESGAITDVHENMGYTALEYAARHGRKRCLERLLQWLEKRWKEAGKEQDEIEKKVEETCKLLLIPAIQSGHVCCVLLVLSKLEKVCGAKIKHASFAESDINNTMRSAYYCATQRNSEAWEIIEILKKYEFKLTDDKYLISDLAENPNKFMQIARNGQHKILKDILQKDQDSKLIELKDAGGCTAFMWTVADDNIDNMNIFLDRTGIDGLKDKDKGGCNVVMWAARKDSRRCLAKLLDFINTKKQFEILSEKDENGMTALMWAAWKRNAECLKTLMRNDDHSVIKKLLSTQDSQGFTALDWAAKGGSERCVEILLNERVRFGKPAREEKS